MSARTTLKEKKKQGVKKMIWDQVSKLMEPALSPL